MESIFNFTCDWFGWQANFDYETGWNFLIVFLPISGVILTIIVFIVSFLSLEVEKISSKIVLSTVLTGIYLFVLQIPIMSIMINSLFIIILLIIFFTNIDDFFDIIEELFESIFKKNNNSHEKLNQKELGEYHKLLK